jgi:integrase
MHKLRKTYGTTLIDNGVDESLIMTQMGHKDISTTRKYYYYANKDSDTNRKQIRNAINF